MKPLNPFVTTIRWRTVLIYAGVGWILLVFALLFDQEIYATLVLDRKYRTDWYHLLRVMGWAPTWLIAAAVLAMHGQREPGPILRRPSVEAGAMLALSVAAAGLIAELAKLSVRRLRPMVTGGPFEWRSFLDHPFEATNLSTPSSHAMVALAATLMLVRLFPRARSIWIALGVGCAITRMLSGAHYFSDVVMAGLLAEAQVRCLWNWHRWNVAARQTEPARAGADADRPVGRGYSLSP